ncbi:MAG: hypothetical protein PHW21_00260 [Candidatus Izemoplasmatales bacterium]|nr:hypothetical protein [Candidatus Izemoplasmatales bacterium]
MKEKDILKRIKETAIKDIPDVFEKINLKNIEIEPKIKKRLNFNFTTYLKIALSSFIFILSGFFIYSNINDSSTVDPTPLVSDIEILGFQTITGAVLLEENYESSLASSTYSNIVTLSSTTNIEINDYVSEINPFMHMLETIINNQGDIEYTLFESDKPEYQKAFRYLSIDLAKNELEFKIYFNESSDSQSGIIVWNENEYSFSSDSLETTISIDEDNYIEVDNQSSENKQLFNYDIYEKGIKKLSNKMEIYQVKGNLEVKSEIIKNGLLMRLVINRKFYTQSDEFEIDYEIEENNQRINGRFSVNLEFNATSNSYNYRYNLPKGNSVDKPRGPISNPGNSKNPRF